MKPTARSRRKALLAAGLLMLGVLACEAPSRSSADEPAPSTTTDAAAAPRDGGSGEHWFGTSDGTCPFPAPRDLPWPFPHGGAGGSPSAYCPDGCAPVEAAQLDEAKGCRRWVLLGCIPCEAGCGGAPEGPSCTKYAADGRLISVAPGYAFSNRAGWTACSPAEQGAMQSSAFCAD